MSGHNRPVPEIGKGYPSNLVKNGEISDGGLMCMIANATFANTFRRFRVLYSRACDVGSSFTAGVTHRARLRIFQENDLRNLYVTVTYGDSGTPGYAGFSTFTLNGVAQTIPAFANTSSASTGPSDLFMVTFHLGNHTLGNNDLAWSAAAGSAINSVIVYGAPIENSTTYASAYGTTPFYAGAPVTESIVHALALGVGDLWKERSTVHFTWSGSFARTSTTYANILDTSTAGYSSAAAGFWAIPLYQASLAETTVSTKFWVHASSTGTTGRVRISNSTGVLATITGIGTAGYYEADANLDPTLSGDLLIVEASEATAAKTITVSGAGLYNLGV